MRPWAAIHVLFHAGLATSAAAEEMYVVNILNHNGIRWTGVASLSDPPFENIVGELCVVRAEDEERAAFPRTLLKIPVAGKRSPESMELRIPEVESGPTFESDAATLQLLTENSDATSNLVPAGSWQFGDLGWGDEEGQRKLGPYAWFIAFTRDPDLVIGSTAISAGDLNHVAFYNSLEDHEAGNETRVDIAAYDQFTREQVRDFERSKIMSDLYTSGIVIVAANIAKIPMIQEILDDLGDGARVLNGEISGCPSIQMTMTVSVPAGLEYWYTRRLQLSGLVDGAYPDVQPRDPFPSNPYSFAPASLRAPLRDRKTPLSMRYKATWDSFEQALRQFAQVRRPGFAQSGVVTSLGSKTGPFFRAEVKGRAIAVCGANRWEWIIVNATVLSLDALAGKASISVTFSDGFEGRGGTLPSDTRFNDNRMSDTALGEIQNRFVSATENGAVPQGTISCRQ